MRYVPNQSRESVARQARSLGFAWLVDGDYDWEAMSVWLDQWEQGDNPKLPRNLRIERKGGGRRPELTDRPPASLVNAIVDTQFITGEGTVDVEGSHDVHVAIAYDSDSGQPFDGAIFVADYGSADSAFSSALEVLEEHIMNREHYQDEVTELYEEALAEGYDADEAQERADAQMREGHRADVWTVTPQQAAAAILPSDNALHFVSVVNVPYIIEMDQPTFKMLSKRVGVFVGEPGRSWWRGDDPLETILAKRGPDRGFVTIHLDTDEYERLEDAARDVAQYDEDVSEKDEALAIALLAELEQMADWDRYVGA